MKIGSINSSICLVNFKSQNEQVQSSQSESKFSDVDKKKLLFAALGALAVAGTVAVIVNNARKGKIKTPEVISAPPKPEPLKPVDIKVIREVPEYSPEALEKRAINGPVKDDAWSFEDMRKYYGNDCADVSDYDKFKVYKYPTTKNGLSTSKYVYKANSTQPEGTVMIEKIKYNKKAHSGIWTDSTYTSNEIYSPDGNLLETSIFNSNFSVKKIFENGKLSKIISDDKAGHTETLFYDGVKTSIHKNKDGSQVYKVYEQDKNGKYHCIRRELFSDKFLKNILGNIDNDCNVKSVEYIHNGKYSKAKTEKLKHYGVSDGVNTAESVVRDKKGNIIDQSKVLKTEKQNGSDAANAGKLLASWYKDYLKLCEKYNVTPRLCDVKGGAGDHYFELCLRRSDAEAYKRFLSLQEYRAKYDEGAMLGQILRIADQKGLSVSAEELAKLPTEDVKTLMSYINKGYINIQDLQNISAAKVKELFVKAKEKEQMIKAAREAERRLEEQRALEYANNYSCYEN